MVLIHTYTQANTHNTNSSVFKSSGLYVESKVTSEGFWFFLKYPQTVFVLIANLAKWNYCTISVFLCAGEASNMYSLNQRCRKDFLFASSCAGRVKSRIELKANNDQVESYWTRPFYYLTVFPDDRPTSLTPQGLESDREERPFSPYIDYVN